MRLSELRPKIRYLKKLGYTKAETGWGAYRKRFSHNDWHKEQWVNAHDIFYSVAFEEYLDYLEDKNIMLLMAYAFATEPKK